MTVSFSFSCACCLCFKDYYCFLFPVLHHMPGLSAQLDVRERERSDEKYFFEIVRDGGRAPR